MKCKIKVQLKEERKYLEEKKRLKRKSSKIR
jgi:hypothetical protein